MSTTRQSEPGALAGGSGGRGSRARPHVLGRLGWSAVIGIVVAGAGSLAVHSPLFRADAIDVSGTSHLTRAQVVAAADVSPATNVFFADPSAIERRLEAQPWISRATVVKGLPSTLRIQVVERRPVVAVEDGRSYRVLAGDGTLLGTTAGQGELPVVEPSAAPNPRRTATVPPSEAAAALAPMPASARRAIAAVVGSPGGGIELRLRSGGAIEYGRPGGARAKAGAVAALLRWSTREGRRLDHADVSVPGAPTATIGLRGEGRSP